ncbi:MAG: type II CAAX endopeptidase family protein [Bacteroidota bacterium]
MTSGTSNHKNNSTVLPAWLKVVLFILAAFLFAILYYIPFSIIPDFERHGVHQLILSQTVLLLGFASAYYFFNRFIENQSSLPRYFKWSTRFFFIGLTYGFIFITVCAGVMALTGIVSFKFSEFYFDLILYLILMFLVSAAEELAFRGYILNALSSSYGKISGILASSFLFGLVHLMNDNSTLFGVLTISLFGVFAALSFNRFSSIWVPIGAHLSWNYTQGSVFGSAISGHERVGVFNMYYHSDISYLTGGDFGLEGSVFLTIIILVAIGIEFYRGKVSPKKGT